LSLLRDPGARYAPGRGSALGLRALVLIAISVGVMVVDHRQHELTTIRTAMSAAAYPLQLLVQSPVSAWNWLASSFATRSQLMEENAGLKSENRENDLRLLRLEAIEQENIRLRELLNAAPRDVETSKVASILRVDLDPLRHRVLIDRGTTDGVTRAQAVIDAHGVFGQTSNVGLKASEVILLSDPTHAVPVQVERNGLRTIAVGTGDARRLALPYLPRNADIRVDDRLVTSGLGGVFPPGYPVGRVSEVKRDATQPLATVAAEPAAALDRARDVMLLWLHPRVPLPASEPPPPPAVVADKPKGKKP
jgi:rod shape-determining protein MreC